MLQSSLSLMCYSEFIPIDRHVTTAAELHQDALPIERRQITRHRPLRAKMQLVPRLEGYAIVYLFPFLILTRDAPDTKGP